MVSSVPTRYRSIIAVSPHTTVRIWIILERKTPLKSLCAETGFKAVAPSSLGQGYIAFGCVCRHFPFEFG